MIRAEGYKVRIPAAYSSPIPLHLNWGYQKLCLGISYKSLQNSLSSFACSVEGSLNQSKLGERDQNQTSNNHLQRFQKG